MAVKVIGQFSYEEGILCGPRDYMEAHGRVLLDRILAGENAIFNLTQGQSPDVETAILVRLRTDYTGWLGLVQAESWLKYERLLI